MSTRSDTDPEEFSGSKFLDALARAPFALVLTDPNADDNPIVYVNDTFTTITGYARDFAVGRNCRFLQKDDRDQPGLDRLRAAVEAGDEIVVDLRNYRPDGEKFINRLMVSPLLGEDGRTRFFVGLQMEVDPMPDADRTTHDIKVQKALEEIQHRVKNHLSMVVSMIRLQAGATTPDPSEGFNMLARRVETLQLLYEELSGEDGEAVSDHDETVALGAYLSRVAHAVAHLDGRPGVRVNIDAEKIRVPFQTATQLGLILSEVTTNALQHAFAGRDEGLLEVEAKTLSNGVFRLLVSDDGVGLPAGLSWPDGGSLGGRIVQSLVTGLDGKLDVSAGGVQGTTVTLDVPPGQIGVGARGA